LRNEYLAVLLMMLSGLLLWWCRPRIYPRKLKLVKVDTHTIGSYMRSEHSVHWFADKGAKMVFHRLGISMDPVKFEELLFGPSVP
jgi:hypothetical protein